MLPGCCITFLSLSCFNTLHGQVAAAGKISEHERCSGVQMKLPETLLALNNGAGDEAESFESLGTSKSLSSLRKHGQFPWPCSSLSPCPGSQDKLNNPSVLLVLCSSQGCLENSHSFVCHSFQSPARDRVEQPVGRVM